MACMNCKRKAVVKFANLEACEACFSEIIEKRIRKEIRLNKLIEKDDRILVIDDGSAEAKLTSYLLPRILKQLPVKIAIEKKKYSIGENIKCPENKIIIPWNAEKEAAYLLDSIFKNKKTPFLGHFSIGKKRYVKMMLPLLHEEAKAMTSIKGIKFKDKKEESYSEKILSSFEKEYTETKFSMLRSSEDIRKVI